MEDYHESLQRMLQAQLKVKINEAKKKEEVPESDMLQYRKKASS